MDFIQKKKWSLPQQRFQSPWLRGFMGSSLSKLKPLGGYSSSSGSESSDSEFDSFEDEYSEYESESDIASDVGTVESTPPKTPAQAKFGKKAMAQLDPATRKLVDEMFTAADALVMPLPEDPTADEFLNGTEKWAKMVKHLTSVKAYADKHSAVAEVAASRLEESNESKGEEEPLTPEKPILGLQPPAPKKPAGEWGKKEGRMDRLRREKMQEDAAEAADIRKEQAALEKEKAKYEPDRVVKGFKGYPAPILENEEKLDIGSRERLEQEFANNEAEARMGRPEKLMNSINKIAAWYDQNFKVHTKNIPVMRITSQSRKKGADDTESWDQAQAKLLGQRNKWVTKK